MKSLECPLVQIRSENEARETSIVAERLEVADTFWTRCRGLQFRRTLPVGTALMLIPCSSVHTAWMRFAIDVVLVDRDGRVIEVHPRVAPWRVLFPRRRAHAVLELAAGTCQLRAGDQLRLETDPSRNVPASLSFLRSPVAEVKP